MSKMTRSHNDNSPVDHHHTDSRITSQVALSIILVSPLVLNIALMADRKNVPPQDLDQ